jgi:phosphoribosylglycinamide formyltransferase-1
MSFVLGQPVSPLRLAVLISGGGTTLRNLIQKIAAKKLDAKIELVISSSATAKGLDFAREANIPTLVVPQAKSKSAKQFSEATFGPCRQAGVHIVVMAGYLKLVQIPPYFTNRVTNIHPALIPACCGPGMYGLRVHEAVLEGGARISGCTVHFVDNQYDHGPIILQRQVPVLDDDTPESLAARVFAAECEAYPEALRLIGLGRVTAENGNVQIKDKNRQRAAQYPSAS